MKTNDRVQLTNSSRTGRLTNVDTRGVYVRWDDGVHCHPPADDYLHPSDLVVLASTDTLTQALTLDQMLLYVRALEASGLVLAGKMKDGSPSIEAKISWVYGQLALSRNLTKPEDLAALRTSVTETVHRTIEDELCDLRAAVAASSKSGK